MRNCLTCGGSLQGLRADALYCRTACRTAGYRERREARIRHKAMREVARAAGLPEDVVEAFDDLEALVPNFAILNAHALDAGAAVRVEQGTTDLPG